MKKTLVMIWLVVSLFIMPAVLDLENGWVLVFIMTNVIASFLTARKVTPEIFN